jgi:hypothetical protein
MPPPRLASQTFSFQVPTMPSEAVVDRVQVAGDGQAAAGAAVRENGRRGHEPQLRDIVVEALGMVLIVGIGVGDAREEVLIGSPGSR